MRNRFHSLNTAGDTIVEVLMAIAVVSAALGGAYASAAQSSRGLRQAQERGEALKLVESQIEMVRTAKAAGHETPKSKTGFCAVQGDSQIKFEDADDPSCKQGTGNRYQLTVQATEREYEYAATATWDKLGGGTEQEKVTIVYRVEQR